MITKNNDIDKNVDEDIFNCLNPNNPKSFFLFAGAGSGKTKTLINVLSKFKESYGLDYKLRNRKIAIITYTNVAANEINHRLLYDSIFEVSTIHSFCWELIKNFKDDIKLWVENDLKVSISKLEDAINKSKDLNNKTAISNKNKLESKIKRLSALPFINKFVYNPLGDNYTKASLNHKEVIDITCYFLSTKPIFKRIVIDKYPIILIDESQDTNAKLIDALFSLQSENKLSFSLGLFGDIMQRIYNDGKEKIVQNLPEDWLKPVKKMNHRSKSRIIKLNNKIREEIDGEQQLARIENEGGLVKLFIVNRLQNKLEVEESIKEKMAILTSDDKWCNSTLSKDSKDNSVKVLTLEHHMAAIRMQFDNFFIPLYNIDRLKEGLINGSLSSINFFIKIILPIYEAYKNGNVFEISNIVKLFSPLFDKNNIKTNKDVVSILDLAKTNIDSLLKLWENDKQPRLISILQEVNRSGIFMIPNELKISIERVNNAVEDDKNNDDVLLLAWDKALNSGFEEIINYNKYITGQSNLGTQQGVKGLEFKRVMVIIDDDEAKGFMFSYDKLFGLKDLSKADKENIAIGKETGIDRTSRLFYVACSRAKESLAIVAYTDNTLQLKDNLLKFGWFSEEEIEII